MRGKLIIALILFGLIGFYFKSYYETNEITFQVTQTEYLNQSEIPIYLVHTNIGIFEIADDSLIGKHDSHKVFNSLNVGETYTANVIGFRSKILSTYKNIIEIK